MPATASHPLITEAVGDVALIRLPVTGFSGLSLVNKQLVYHLYQASLAGRDITYDQSHRMSLDLRRSLEQVLASGGDDLASIGVYAKRIWLNTGVYDAHSHRKITPGFTREQWSKAAIAANVSVVDGLTQLMFDPAFELYSVRKPPPRGSDLLTASGTNFYHGVTLKEANEFDEKYPLNSRLVKRGGRLLEEIYRAGRSATGGQRPAPPGRYARELSAVCGHLRRALPFADSDLQATLRHLIDYFESGEPPAFERANVAWLTGNSTVELVLGFIETDADPRAVKGQWEGVVAVFDAHAGRLMGGLADHAAYFEDRSPWEDRFKRTGIRVSVPKAVQVIGAHGGAAPMLPVLVNLPNDQATRERYGSKSLLFANVRRAVGRAVMEVGLDEFSLPGERAAARKHGVLAGEVFVALHKIVGHASGKMAGQLDGKDPSVFLKEYTAALEECRADLVALHHIWDPKIPTLAAGCNAKCAEVAYRDFVRRDLRQLGRVRGDRIEDDHVRASHLIVQYLIEKGAVALEKHQGKHYQIVKDLGLMRTAVAELLATVTRIRGEGDYAATRALFQRHGLFFDRGLRDEVAKRVSEAGIPKQYAFIMPELRRVKNAQGKVINVVVDEPRDFEAQMMRWRTQAIGSQ